MQKKQYEHIDVLGQTNPHQITCGETSFSVMMRSNLSGPQHKQDHSYQNQSGTAGNTVI